MTDLCQHLANALVPDSPAAKEPVPFTAKLCDLVETIREELGKTDGKSVHSIVKLCQDLT